MTSIRTKLFDLALAPTAPKDTQRPVDLLARGQPALATLRALELRRDMIAPPESAGLVEALVERFNAAPTSGDHLRLPRPPGVRGPEMRAAVGRFLEQTAGTVAAPSEALAKERELRRLLTAYQSACEEILARSQEG